MLQWLRSHITSVASATVLGLASAVTVVLAVTSPGYTATSVSLDDAGVWVTRTDHAVVGQVSTEIRQSVMALPSFGAENFDVLQDGSAVFVVDAAKSAIRSVDVAGRRFTGSGVSIPGQAQVALGGGTLAVLDPSGGNLWVRAAGEAVTEPFNGSAGITGLGRGAAVAVGPDGVVHVASPATGRLLNYILTPGGVQVRDRTTVKGLTASSAVSITAVGSVPVVLLATQRQVVVADHDPVALAAGSANITLQQSGEAADSVLLSTDTSLLSLPLDGGELQTLSSSGTGAPVAAPVRARGCVYAAWGKEPVLVTGCGAAEPKAAAVGAKPGTPLVFRVNRSRVVLNDPATGDTFMADDPKTSIAQWDRLKQQSSQEDAEQSQQTQQKVETVDRKGQNRPPQPIADVFGARPGSTVVLPVLANDTDPDGDVLTVAKIDGELPEAFGVLRRIQGGRALQFTAGTQAGTQTVSYVADDGRLNGTASSTVKITIVPRSAPDRAPQRLGGVPLVSVGRNLTVSYDVLQDWRDPDGDPLVLTCPGADDAVHCTPDGVLTYRDAGQRTGTVAVRFTIGDGIDAPVNGQLDVKVVDPQDPLTRPDFATGVAGVPLTIRPLDNDSAYSSDGLVLSNLKSSDATVTPTFDADGVVHLTPTAEGRLYFTYVATAGDRSAAGLIRVDVTKVGGTHPPVPAPDSAVLRPLVPTVVDVLANDTDDDGDVLVLLGAGGSAGQDGVAPAPAADAGGATDVSGLRIEVIGHRLLRLTAQAGFRGPVSLPYAVSDGTSLATGVVAVRLSKETQDQSPVARDDKAVVRAGSVTSVPVLANDLDPEGLPLTVDRALGDVTFRRNGSTTNEPVTAFVSGDLVRVVAPGEPGRVTLSYTARDRAGQPASATLTLQVTAAATQNSAPVPPALEARVIAGRSTTIVVPLAGSDPDGDPVTLAAPSAQPAQGRLELDRTRPDAFVYTPRDNASGADKVTYQIVDALGAVGTGVIRVGIAQPPAQAEPPVVVDDSVVVRNDRPRVVDIPVLANDTSALGDPVLLDRAGLKVLTAGAKAALVGNTVEVTVPQGATAPLLSSYTVTAGGVLAVQPGLVTVTPDAAAPFLAPTARDDVAASADGAPLGVVDVVANDTDPDAAAADLVIPTTANAVGPVGVAVRLDARHVRVTAGRSDRWAWYTVTDQDGQTAQAVIRIPGTASAPRLRDGAHLDLKAGASQTISLAEYVVSASGKAVRLADTTHVSGSGVTVRASTSTSVAITAAASFGPAAATFEVSDGDRQGYVTLPVTIVATQNRAPTLRPQALTVAKGDAAGKTIDLEAATDDDPADRGRHTYRLVGSTGGITASITGSLLKVAAGNGAAAVPVALSVEVSDGKLKGTGQVSVTVVETLKPPPQASDCSATTGQLLGAGSTFTVDVARCTSNAAGGATGLVVSVSSVTGTTAQVSGTAVTVQVAPTFHGKLAIPYSVKDSLGRVASARILASIVDKPSAPGQPQLVSSPTAGVVVIRWAAADPSGGTISRYTVRGTGVTQVCSSDVPQCTVSGLDPKVTYTFTVTATNERGDGPPSSASAGILAATAPAPPTGFTAVAGNQVATLSWTAPPGAAVQSYTITPTPAAKSAPVPFTAAGTATSTTFTGLVNGTTYTFAITAKNAQGVSDPVASAAVTPSGPVSLTAPKLTPGGTGASTSVTVDWTTSLVGINGTVKNLTIHESSNAVAAVDVTSVAASGSHTLTVSAGKTYSFYLTATNNGNFTGQSPAATTTAVGPPAVPKWGFFASQNLYDKYFPIEVDNVDKNGLASLTITWSGGSFPISISNCGFNSWDGTVGKTCQVMVTGLTNGVKYDMVAVVCNTAGACASSVAFPYTPIGSPIPPAIDATVTGTKVTFSWGVGSTEGHGGAPPFGGMTVTGPSAGTCSPVWGQAGSCSFTGTPGGTYQATWSVQYSGKNCCGSSKSPTVTVAAATFKIGDINKDGLVNCDDYAILLSDWGTNASRSDLNGDGTVDVRDLSRMLTNWDSSGNQSCNTVTPTPSAPAPPAPAPAPVVAKNMYDNYGAAVGAGYAMCRGNPGDASSNPGGTVEQTFQVPSGGVSLTGATVQIDPATAVTAHLSVLVNGSSRASSTAIAAGDTNFSFGSVSVAAGDTVTVRITFSATAGSIITVYGAGNPGGTFRTSNSCSASSTNSTRTDVGLRAVVQGTGR